MGGERLAWWSRREALGLGLIASTSLVGLGSALYGRGDRQLPGSPRYPLGRLRDLYKRLDATGGLLTYPELRAHLVRYSPTAESRAIYSESVPGLLLLSWVCPHLGCKLPRCESSQWFECPCHGARFNGIGEYQFGPPPRGMDRHALRFDSSGDVLVADTASVVAGAPRGTNTIGQAPTGAHCVG
ncbi:MAG TPA: Rieske 2Fe-2S domain-containing protein [Mycobacteriales bacterium]|nr:Rieske 2Fe-2S domain-containing protein [Mycobacteriales bacterium]